MRYYFDEKKMWKSFELDNFFFKGNRLEQYKKFYMMYINSIRS